MISYLPTLNASLNALAALFLILGRRAARRHDVVTHRKLMATALTISALFLTSYLTYHFLIPEERRYAGPEGLRAVYYFILITHIPLAALIVPAAFWVTYLGVSHQVERHRSWARWVWPLWMYVSVTGVLIYCFLYLL